MFFSYQSLIVKLDSVYMKDPSTVSSRSCNYFSFAMCLLGGDAFMSNEISLYSLHEFFHVYMFILADICNFETIA